MQIIVRNVTEAVRLPKQKQFEAKALSEREIDSLLNALRDTIIYIPTFLAVGLGTRRGETLGLKWSDINFEKGLITIERQYIPTSDGNVFADLKTIKSKRTLGVSDSIMQILRQSKVKQIEDKLFFGAGYNNSDLVCCNKDGSPISPATWNHSFKRLIKLNNLPDIRIHDLRHTNASLLLKNGVSMKVTSETRTYYNRNNNELIQSH